MLGRRLSNELGRRSQRGFESDLFEEPPTSPSVFSGPRERRTPCLLRKSHPSRQAFFRGLSYLPRSFQGQMARLQQEHSAWRPERPAPGRGLIRQELQLAFSPMAVAAFLVKLRIRHRSRPGQSQITFSNVRIQSLGVSYFNMGIQMPFCLATFFASG